MTNGGLAHPWGVGSPGIIKLHEFGRILRDAFGGVIPQLVGSSLIDKRITPRDIDVRLVLPDATYIEQIGPLVECGQPFTRWSALTLAFSALGQQMTGLNIDFQIQPESHAARYATQPCYDLATPYPTPLWEPA
jgi:hypothetical protein